jgi:hypothetical protein
VLVSSTTAIVLGVDRSIVDDTGVDQVRILAIKVTWIKTNLRHNGNNTRVLVAPTMCPQQPTADVLEKKTIDIVHPSIVFTFSFKRLFKSQ